MDHYIEPCLKDALHIPFLEAKCEGLPNLVGDVTNMTNDQTMDEWVQRVSDGRRRDSQQVRLGLLSVFLLHNFAKITLSSNRPYST